MKDVIPTALSRRIILALLGFTYVDGRWWLSFIGPVSLAQNPPQTGRARL